MFDRYGSINNITLKQKESISFAFIEYNSTEEAEKAIN
jgi:hypothetical protein